MQHTFLVHLSLFCTTTTRNIQKLLNYTFFWENVVRVLVHFFFTAAHFLLALVAAGISPLSTPLQSFHVVLPTKNVSFVLFLSLTLDLCRPFSRWVSMACRLLSLSLYFSCSIFQICGHDNESKLNTLDNTDTETISAFRFRLYWLFSCPCFTRRGWLRDFLPK